MKTKKYDVFISYYSGTGSDFAKFLKTKLKDFGINSFLDISDIPKSIKKESDEWRKIIDEALLNSKKFILLMTLGFNSRPEVLRELKIASDKKIERIQFKHVNLPEKDLTVKIENKIHDLSKFQYLEFENEPDLLRKLGAELFGSVTLENQKTTFFKFAQDLIYNEGANVRRKNIPMIEIVIGSTNKIENWFPISNDNKKIVQMAPIWCNCTTRRKFYECETRKDTFLRVYPNGFFHFIIPIIFDDQKNLSWIDVIVHQIIDVLIYCIRVMKYRNVNINQSFIAKLRNFTNLEFKFDMSFFHRSYTFCPELTEIDFTNSFNPQDDWKDFRIIFENLFQDLCMELGISDIPESNIKKRIVTILKKNSNIHTEYKLDNIIFHRLGIDDFGYNEEKI